MEKYYTVEQAANLLSLHPKTIQRYVREGKIRANKIGKSWCIAGRDLRAFAEKSDDRVFEESGAFAEKATVSSVADIPVRDQEESGRMMNLLAAALNSRSQGDEKASMHMQYLEHEDKLRITLWGDVDFMKTVFEILSAITG